MVICNTNEEKASETMRQNFMLIVPAKISKTSRAKHGQESRETWSFKHAAGGKLMSPHQKTLGMSKKGEDAHTLQGNNPACRPRPWREPHTEVPEDTAKGSGAKSATLKRGDTDVSSAVGR